MRRLTLLVICLCCVGAAIGAPRAESQSTATAPGGIAISPPSGDQMMPRVLRASNLSASAQITIVLFDPTGHQTVLNEETDPNGALEIPLNPPPSGWIAGVYRAAIALDGGQTTTATFAVGDSQPHVYLAATVPSVTSAFNFSGTGFAPNQPVGLEVRLGNDRGDRSIPVAADANGVFSITVWPQQEGEPFFEAGGYAALVPGENVYVPFFVREHPAASLMTISPPATAGGPVHFHLIGYPGQRYLWTAYSNLAGTVRGELLLGPTDQYGRLDEDVVLPSLPGGQYLVATPYDWGESTVVLPAPPPTSTPTATATSTPTSTATPTPTVIKPNPCPKNAKKRHGACVCKKGYKLVHGKCKRVTKKPEMAGAEEERWWRSVRI